MHYYKFLLEKLTLDIRIKNLSTKVENPGRSSAAATETNWFSSKSTSWVLRNQTKWCSSDQDGSTTPQRLMRNGGKQGYKDDTLGSPRRAH